MVEAVAVVVEVLVIWQANLLVAFSQTANQTTNNNNSSSRSSSSSQVINPVDMKDHQVEDREEEEEGFDGFHGRPSWLCKYSGP